MKKIITAIIALLLLPISGQACLTTSETLQWHDIELQLNITNDTLVNLAEQQCVRAAMSGNVSAALDDLKDRIEDLRSTIDYDSIDGRVDERMQNYTNVYEEIFSTHELLYMIYNDKVNSTSNINPNVTYVSFNDFDSKVKDIEEDIINIKNDMRSTSQTGFVTGKVTGFDYTPYLIVVVIVVMLLFVFRKPLMQKVNAMSQPVPTGQMQSMLRNSVQDPENPENLKSKAKERFKEFARENKIRALKRDLQEAGKMKNKKERDVLIAKLTEEAEEALGEEE